MKTETKKGNALIILGHENSDKTETAIQEAKKLGAYFISNIENILSPFGLGSVLNNDIKSIIVEDCPIRFLEDHRIKLLISENKLLIERRGKDPKLMKNVQWIFIVCLDRRFSIINL